MAPAKTPIPTWSDMATPNCATQRIAYIEACQRYFEVVRAVGPASGALLFPCEGVVGAAAARDDQTPLHYFTAIDDVSTPAHAATCVVCARPASAAIVANPFSDWSTVLCEACTPS